MTSSNDPMDSRLTDKWHRGLPGAAGEIGSQGSYPSCTIGTRYMRRRDFITLMGLASSLPQSAWSQSSTCESAPGTACSPDIPLQYDDTRFGRNEASGAVKLPPNGTVSNKSITETNGTASIVIGNGGTIRNCRVNSRECVRIGGSGTFLIDHCYLEARGVENDHADVIQAYSPGSRGILKVTNTAIATHDIAATAGLFIADNWTGTIELENVAFIGGGVGFGLRVHPDTGGDNIVRLKNVFFVPPFGYGPFYFKDFGGRKNIIELWENVRIATISNGQLVPRKPLPKPR